MVRHHHCVTLAVALTAALAAAAPASARPELNPSPTTAGATVPTSTNVCSEVCSGDGYTTGVSASTTSTRRGAQLPHDPRPRAQLFAGTGAPATATPSTATGPRSEVVSGHGYGPPAAAPTIVRVVAPANGFDWGDAGVGAGGAVALMLLLAGGFFALSGIRHRARPVPAERTT